MADPAQDPPVAQDEVPRAIWRQWFQTWQLRCSVIQFANVAQGTLEKA